MSKDALAKLNKGDIATIVGTVDIGTVFCVRDGALLGING